MDICQDEGCPNYVIDEPNKCITFKQVSECPTPDYLNSNKEPVAEVPCSVGLEGLQVDLVMLTAAMSKAVEVGIVAKYADEETYLKNWSGVREILQAALAA